MKFVDNSHDRKQTQAIAMNARMQNGQNRYLQSVISSMMFWASVTLPIGVIETFMTALKKASGSTQDAIRKTNGVEKNVNMSVSPVTTANKSVSQKAGNIVFRKHQTATTPKPQFKKPAIMPSLPIIDTRRVGTKKDVKATRGDNRLSSSQPIDTMVNNRVIFRPETPKDPATGIIFRIGDKRQKRDHEQAPYYVPAPRHDGMTPKFG